nr:MAG TPA: hypothetical protein [Bacteriophage sp.]
MLSIITSIYLHHSIMKKAIPQPLSVSIPVILH